MVPMVEKDKWNSAQPKKDKRYAKYVNQPELAGLLPSLYPGVFPNLETYDKPRADLNAILLTGHPEGDRGRLRQLHRAGRGRHAAAQRGGAADQPG